MPDLPTTWYVCGPLVVFAAIAGVAVLVKPSLLNLLSPTTPQDPGDDDREASGADEQYPEDLKAAKVMLPSPDLIRPSEQMDADHEALAEIGRALDHFGEVMTDALSRFLRNQPTVLLRLPSSIEVTGELPVVEMVGGK